MKLSKTRFINDLRCNRYPALDELYTEKNKAVVAFSDDPELEEIMSLENKEKMSFLLDDMTDENDEDIIEKPNLQMETMLKYYNDIEIIAGEFINKKYGGKIIYSLDTYKQKRFEFEHEGFKLYCFIDGYQEDQESIRIFEVKATTSKKFIDIKYKTDEGEKLNLFEYSSEHILHLQADLLGPLSDDYHKKVSGLKDRLSKVGRYIYDLSYQRYVFEASNHQTKHVKYYLAVLNSNYIHDGKTDEHQHPIYGDDLIQLIDLTSLTKEMMPVIEEDIKSVIKRLNTMNANPVPLGRHCQRKDVRKCKFIPVCYKHIPELNSLFTYIDHHHGFKDDFDQKRNVYDLIDEGFIHALDIPRTWLKRQNNIIQRDVIESEKPYYDIEKIEAGLSEIKYPIYHLDFETFPCPLPRFKGEKPYSQSLFQYSIHIEREKGVCDKDLDNYSYIATKHEDLREDLIKNMLDVIKDDGGTILVYNESFEKTRLKEMGEIFPKYKKRLDDLISRMFDLMYLVKTNTKLFVALGFEEERAKKLNFYDTYLNGSFSIKKVLPIFSELTYKGMNIGNGTDALVAYARFPNMDDQEFEKTYQDLLEYCKQDTWAMVEILAKLREL